MPDRVDLMIDGDMVTVDAGSTVASAILIAGHHCRTSVTGEPRGPLCGMGICYECRAIVNGTPHVRTCQLVCEPFMEVRTT